MFEEGQRVRVVHGLHDISGDEPDFFVPPGSIGIVIEGDDFPVVYFGDVCCAVHGAEVEAVPFKSRLWPSDIYTQLVSAGWHGEDALRIARYYAVHHFMT